MQAPPAGKKNGKDIFLIPVITEKERYSDTDADELRQRQVHEDDPSLEDVDAEIRVDQDQKNAGQKRASEETEQLHLFLLYLRACSAASIRLNQSVTPGAEPTSCGTIMVFTPVIRERASTSFLPE